MIRLIAAIDSKKGLATNNGIPWKLPADIAYFRHKTEGGTVIMGYKTYTEFVQPLPNRINLVAVRGGVALREGFRPVLDLEHFLRSAKVDVWVIGGASLYARALQFADELYLTRLEADFGCTKFFPDFASQFEILDSTEPQIYRDILDLRKIVRSQGESARAKTVLSEGQVASATSTCPSCLAFLSEGREVRKDRREEEKQFTADKIQSEEAEVLRKSSISFHFEIWKRREGNKS